MSFWCWVGIHHYVDADDGYDRGMFPSARYESACVRDGCSKVNTRSRNMEIARRKLAIAKGEIAPEKATLSLVAVNNSECVVRGGSDGDA